MKNEQGLRDLWDTIKHIKTCIMGVPEGEEKKKRGRKNIWGNINEAYNHTHSKNSKQDKFKEIHTMTYYYQIIKDKENLESSKRKVVQYVQEIFNNISGFLRRNLSGEKTMVSYI